MQRDSIECGLVHHRARSGLPLPGESLAEGLAGGGGVSAGHLEERIQDLRDRIPLCSDRSANDSQHHSQAWWSALLCTGDDPAGAFSLVVAATRDTKTERRIGRRRRGEVFLFPKIEGTGRRLSTGPN